MDSPLIDRWIADVVQSDLKQIIQKPEILLALVLVAVSVLYVFLQFLAGRSKGGLKKAALVGPCDAGKTCVFHQLIGTNIPEATVASMEENDGIFRVLNDKQRPVGAVRIVDVPGHVRLRHKLDQHLKDARAVVFVLDAVDITPNKMEAAEELFDVLTHPHISRRRVPILLACNQMDLEAAHSVEFIQRMLEKQLDAMRKTRTALSPEAAAKAASLGRADKTLTFSSLRNNISVLPISALRGDIVGVHGFLIANVL